MAITTTIGGTTTVFLPLSTAWPSYSACSNYIYAQQNGNFIAWDPWYATVANGAASSCWPPQASSWWNVDLQNTATITALGPTFACPAAYTPVFTSTTSMGTSSILQQTFCCPSNYDFVAILQTSSRFPNQCTSKLTSGQALTWVKVTTNTAGAFSLATDTTVPFSTSVFGVPINGFNVVAATATATSSSSSSSSTGTTSSSTTGTASTSSTTSGANAADNTNSAANSNNTIVASTGTPLGVSVGVSVGVVCGVLLVAAGCFFLWRRSRRRQQQRQFMTVPHEAPGSSPQMYGYPPGGPPPHMSPDGSAPSAGGAAYPPYLDFKSYQASPVEQQAGYQQQAPVEMLNGQHARHELQERSHMYEMP